MEIKYAANGCPPIYITIQHFFFSFLMKSTLQQFNCLPLFPFFSNVFTHVPLVHIYKILVENFRCVHLLFFYKTISEAAIPSHAFSSPNQTPRLTNFVKSACRSFEAWHHEKIPLKFSDKIHETLMTKSYKLMSSGKHLARKYRLQ